MSTTLSSGNSTYPSALRVFFLANLLAQEQHSIEQALDVLGESNLGVSRRHLERDLKLVNTLFGVSSRIDEAGRKFWGIQHPCAWHRYLTPRQAGKGTDEALAHLAVHETDDPIIFERDSLELGRRASILIRLMLIVEMLPTDSGDYDDEDEDHPQDQVDGGNGMSVSEIRARLESYGLHVHPRTIQRDLRFIQHHFLIIPDREGTPSAKWSRLEGQTWLGVFEPRLPEVRRSRDVVVNRFFSGSQPASKKKSPKTIH